MKSKIILSNFLDILLSIIISGFCMIPFTLHFLGLIKTGEIEQNMLIYYLMSYFISYYIIYMLINLAYRFICSVLFRGKTLGRYLQYLSLVDVDGYPNDIKTLLVRDVLIGCLLNYVTLYLFNLVELVRVLMGKTSFTNKWSKTKYIKMEEENGVIY